MDTPVVVLVLSAILLEFVGFVGIVTGSMGAWAAVGLWGVALGFLLAARAVEHFVDVEPRGGKTGRGA